MSGVASGLKLIPMAGIKNSGNRAFYVASEVCWRLGTAPGDRNKMMSERRPIILGGCDENLPRAMTIRIRSDPQMRGVSVDPYFVSRSKLAN